MKESSPKGRPVLSCFLNNSCLCQQLSKVSPELRGTRQFDAIVTGAAEKDTWVRLVDPPIEGIDWRAVLKGWMSARGFAYNWSVRMSSAFSVQKTPQPIEDLSNIEVKQIVSPLAAPLSH